MTSTGMNTMGCGEREWRLGELFHKELTDAWLAASSIVECAGKPMNQFEGSIRVMERHDMRRAHWSIGPGAVALQADLYWLGIDVWGREWDSLPFKEAK